MAVTNVPTPAPGLSSLAEAVSDTEGIRSNRSHGLELIVPFYRNASLATKLFHSLRVCGDELAALHGRLIAVNDSPGDEELEKALSEAAAGLGEIEVRLLRNERNLGFVRSVNRALELSAGERRDVVLLNSDTIPFPGALREISEVARLDPMIGFVSPRSNDATICSLPHQPQFRELPPEEAHAAFLALRSHLPRYQYVPTAVGFCLFIKAEILEEFGFFDEIYAQGYNEENDLIMRANRCGYRAALANHAYVYHVGQASFRISDCPASVHEQRNAALLDSRYPEYRESVARYIESAEYEAERMLTAVVPYRDGRLDLVFDFMNVGTYHCGTFEVAKRLLSQALEQWRERFHIHVMVSEPAKAFHELGKLRGLQFVPPESPRTFAVAVHAGQPFHWSTIERMSALGVLNLYVMLDTIAYDCLYLNSPSLRDMWRFVMSHASGVVYISEFVRQQFNRRFVKGPHVREAVAYPSLDQRDYECPVRQSGQGDYLLVIGNRFAHKWLEPTVAALAKAFPGEKIVVIGCHGDFGRNVTSYESGQITDQEMDHRYADAKLVIYPSLYEGFGIPVVKALALRKPVLVRAIPVMHELRELVPGRSNLHLYSSTRDLIARLRRGAPTWQDDPGTADRDPYGWREAVRDIEKIIHPSLASGDLRDPLIRRIESLRACSVGGTSGTGGELRALQARIDDIHASWSWRLTAPLRVVGGWFLRSPRK